jgi:hypothetical protein
MTRSYGLLCVFIFLSRFISSNLQNFNRWWLFWRLDEQLKCYLVALCQYICYSHFMLNVNKPHSLLLPYFPLWEFRNRNIPSSWLVWGMSHRKDTTSSLVNIHRSQANPFLKLAVPKTVINRGSQHAVK